MKPSQYMNIINDLEKKFPVDRWVIDGIHAWPLIRILLANKMQNRTQAIDADHRYNAFHKLKVGFNLLNSILKYSYSFALDFPNNEMVAQKKDAIFLTITNDRVLLNGSFYNRFVDPLVECLDDLGAKSLVLEMAPRGKYCIPRHRSSKYIQPCLDYCLLRNNIPIKIAQHPNFQLDSYDEFINYFESLNLGISTPSAQHVKKKLSLVRDIASYFEKIIEQTNASIGLTTQYYDVIGMAFNLACRKANIISVDIQHGMQGELHRAYGRWLKVPEKGYELLPEVFWCWSEQEAKTIKSWNSGIEDFHKPLVGGNSWLIKWLNEKDPMVSTYDEKILKLKGPRNDMIHILYTLQIEAIPEWVLQSILESSDSCFWWIRVHPTQIHQRAQIKKLLRDYNLNNTELERASEWPVYALLRNSDAHVTAWSTTVLEAADFGVPSIIIHEFGADLFQDQISSGVAKVAYSTEELLQGIKYQCKRKGERKLPREILTANSCEGLEVLLDQISDAKALEDRAVRDALPRNRSHYRLSC